MESQCESDRHRRRIMRHLEAVTGHRFTGGNGFRILRNGDEIFPPMLQAIRESTDHIEFLTFVYWSGPIADEFSEALAERARAGVRVRVILDSFGAHKMPSALVENLKQAGVEVRWFRPLMNWRVWTIDNRTHRKVLVCDGHTAFTGGVGIASEWEGDARNPDEWRDTHFEIKGPAVPLIQAAFWGNWFEAEGGLASDSLPVHATVTRDLAEDAAEDGLPSEAAPVDRPNEPTELLVLRSTTSPRWSTVASTMAYLMVAARKRLRIVTPYFSPDDSMTEAIRQAVLRGVDVEIMFPGQHADKQMPQLASAREIERLIEAGVTVYRYERTMLHTKAVLVDDAIALVGSANFNHRSWTKDDEVCIVLADRRQAAILHQQFDDDIAACQVLDRESFCNRPMGRKVAETFARVIKPQT